MGKDNYITKEECDELYNNRRKIFFEYLGVPLEIRLSNYKNAKSFVNEYWSFKGSNNAN